MTAALSRAARQQPAAPVRLVHLGLGSFFRAHQAWYTQQAPEQWGIAAFEGRGSGIAAALRRQDNLYTLVTRTAGADRFDVVGSLSAAHDADDHDGWRRHLADPAVGAVTVTVTEAGYLRGPDGGLDGGRPDVRADVDALRRDLTSAVRSAPARLVAGLAARRRADAGPLALVPCDNLPGNGAVAARVVRDLAELVDPALAAWIEQTIPTVTTMVDRITPRTTPADLAAVAAVGLQDACPVVTEPFHEWVLSGTFPAGRPSWQDAGATFTDDIGPFEERKLWLLNGGHSLLAYAASVRGHATVAEAVTDETVTGWLEQWWTEAAGGLRLPDADLTAYRVALRARFRNPRMRHQLGQIAADGSQKLPVRILPTLRRERAAGRLPTGAIVVLAGWVCHLRGLGVPVDDVRATELVGLAGGPLPRAVRQVLAALDLPLGDDRDLVAAVLDRARQLAHPGAA